METYEHDVHMYTHYSSLIARSVTQTCLCFPLSHPQPNPSAIAITIAVAIAWYNKDSNSMGFYDKNNNANGRDPDFGAIFMSSSATKRECFQRRLFGLPSSLCQFVEQVKAGMILFLFEYETRQLHGVFKASCDGAMNIVPNAFSSSGKQFPAQVKFIPIWYCRPLLESSFCDAIRENYFSANKFNFGLSENQVHKLLYLFSMKKLEQELPGRQLTRMKDLKSECYPAGKVGRFVDRGMHVESVKNEQGVGANILPIISHKYQGDSLQYNGEVENIGFNASDVAVNKHGRDAELVVDSTSGHVSDYLAMKDECGFTAQDKEHYMDIHLRPTISSGYSRTPSDKIRVQGDGRLSMSDRLMSEELGKTRQRMVFSYDSPGLHHSNVNTSVSYSKPILERDSSIQNQLRPTSAMLHPIQAQIPNNSCATQGDASSKNTLLYDPDAPGLNFSQSSSVRIDNSSKSMLESASLSNNCGRNSLSNQPCLMQTELKDMNRGHNDFYGFLDPVPYGSNRTCIPFNMARNSEQLAAESVVYEACDSIPFLESPSAPLLPSDIGNSSRVHDPFSSVFHDYKSCVGNDVHPIALQENLDPEMTLEKNNETFIPVVPWANDGHSQVQYGDPLIHEYDNECYGNSQSYNSGYPKKKSSVFSRLSFMQDVNKQENGNNTWHGEYDFRISVDEVMEMVCQSQKQWTKKRKLKPLFKHNNAESLRDKTQIISSRLKGDCFEKSLKNVSKDLTTASGGNTNQTGEGIFFVDFKRRNKVRKINDETKIRSSNESERSENLVFVPQKRRKLIRPNFSKSTTSDDKGTDPSASQNLQVSLSHECYNPKDVSESCCALVQNKDSIQTDAEAQNIVCETHSEDKSSHATGCVCSRRGGKAIEGAHTVFNDGSACLENLNNQNAFSSASCEDKSYHSKEGSCMKDKSSHASGVVCSEGGGEARDGAYTVFNDGSECLKNFNNQNAFSSASCEDKSCHSKEDKSCHSKEGSCMKDKSSHVTGGVCSEGGREARDGAHTVFNDGSESLEHFNNQNAFSSSSCKEKSCHHIKEGSCMKDSIKSVSPDPESLHSLCQAHHVDKVICAGRGINTEERMSKDSCFSFTIEDKD